MKIIRNPGAERVIDLVRPRMQPGEKPFISGNAARRSCARRSAKLVTAWPERPLASVSICITSTLRDQLCSMALAAYQRRVSSSASLSSKAIW